MALPYRKYGLQVYVSGINYVVAIPELDAHISYNGLSFSIRLPYRLFGNNTKGQCGEPLAGRPGAVGTGARGPACFPGSAQGPGHHPGFGPYGGQ